MKMLMRHDMGKLAEPVAARYWATMDSINLKQQNVNLSVMAARLEAEHTETENHRLAASKAHNEAQIRLLIAIISGVVALAALLGIAVVTMRRKKAQLSVQHQHVLSHQQALEAQAQYLQEVNEGKNILLSVISHDVRGPVRSLGAVLDLALAGHLSQNEMTMLLGNLRQEVAHTSHLLDDVLVWAKDQLGGINTQLTTVNCNALVQELEEAFRLQALQKGVEISSLPTRGPMLARADEGLTRVVLRNLISNALRVSVAPAAITLRTELVGNEVCLSIQDQGPGIPQDKLNLLLSPGQQVMRTRSDAAQGFGFVLVRNFTQRQGGRIEVETSPQGSTIRIYLAAIEAIARQVKAEERGVAVGV